MGVCSEPSSVKVPQVNVQSSTKMPPKKGKAATSAVAKETIPVKEAEVVDSEAVASDAEVVSEEDEPVLAEVTPRNAAKKKIKRKMGKEKTGLTFNPYQTRQLHGRRAGVFGGRNHGDRRQLCSGQQEEAHHPRHIALAIKMDEECNQLLEGVIMPQGGVLPFI